MNLSLLIPVSLGILSILQAGMNRKISDTWGLGATTVLNNAVLLLSSFILYFYCRVNVGSLPRILEDRASIGSFSLWYLLPGILGLGLVAGIPYAIARMGAVQVFIPLIAAQIFASIAWDLTFENQPLNAMKLTGAGFTLLGVILFSLG